MAKEFKIKIRSKDEVDLVFENQIHEQYFDKLLEMKVRAQSNASALRDVVLELEQRNGKRKSCAGYGTCTAR